MVITEKGSDVHYGNTGIEFEANVEHVHNLVDLWGINNFTELHPDVTYWEIVEKYGLPKYRILGPKTLPGSLGMLFGSFMSLLVTGFYFSIFWGLQLLPYIVLALIVAVIATFIELFSPKGIDNITIPLICALIFYLAIQVILV